MKTQEQVFREALIAVLPALRRYCFALTNSRPDGEDLLQASVEKALSRWQQFTPGTDMDRWMYRLCRNHWIDTVRAQRPQEEFEDDMMPDHEHQGFFHGGLQQVFTIRAAVGQGKTVAAQCRQHRDQSLSE